MALPVSLASGQAYFRGVVSRQDNPAVYWQIAGSYGVLALLGFLVRFTGK